MPAFTTPASTSSFEAERPPRLVIPNAAIFARPQLRRRREERAVGRVRPGPAALDIVDPEPVQRLRDPQPCPRPRSRPPGSAARRAAWCRRGRGARGSSERLQLGGVELESRSHVVRSVASVEVNACGCESISDCIAAAKSRAARASSRRSTSSSILSRPLVSNRSPSIAPSAFVCDTARRPYSLVAEVDIAKRNDAQLHNRSIRPQTVAPSAQTSPKRQTPRWPRGVLRSSARASRRPLAIGSASRSSPHQSPATPIAQVLAPVVKVVAPPAIFASVQSIGCR